MKADIHVHTSDSACSSMSLVDAVAAALSHDIRVIAVCNHDSTLQDTHFGSIEKALSVRINPPARCENEFYIIPGIELSTKYGHILGLFVNKDIQIDKNDPLRSIHNVGGLAVLAHPFEQTTAFEKRELALSELLTKIDLIEAASARANYKNRDANNQALKLAEKYGIRTSAGSDAHFPKELGAAYMEIDDGFQSLDELKDRIRNPLKLHCKNSKRTYIAKSQFVKNKKKKKFKCKTVLFYLYCLMRDMGDKLCRK